MKPFISFLICSLLAVLWLLLVISDQGSLLHTEIPGHPNDDAFQGIYLHHMVHESIYNGNWDLYDAKQFFPEGYHRAASDGGNSIEMIVSGVLRLFFPWPLWYGLAHYIWIPLNFLGFLPLGRYMWKKWSLSIAIAACWSILPYTLDFIAYGRLTQAVQVFIPLTILGLLLLFEKRRRSTPFFLGLCMGLCAWSYWYFAIFLAFLSFIFLCWGRTKRHLDTLSKDILCAVTIAICTVLPLVAMIYAPTLRGYQQPSSPISTLSISPIFPDALKLHGEGLLLWTIIPFGLWIPLLVGLMYGKRRFLWAICIAICVCFAMGPALLYNDLVWFLPYYPIWKTFPLLDRLLHPERWMLVGGLFFCLLAGEGILHLYRKLPKIRRLISIGVLLLPIIHLYQLQKEEILPLPTWNFSIPEVWTEVAKLEGAIIVIPLMNAQLSCQYQPFHQKSTLGGMLENQPWNYPPEFLSYVEGNGLLMTLFALHNENLSSFSVYQKDLDELHETGFRYVVFERSAWERLRSKSPSTQQTSPLISISRALGKPFFQNSKGDAIWEIPQNGRPGRSPRTGSSIRSIGPADPVPEGAPPL